MPRQAVSKISDHTFSTLLHKTEESRFDYALMIAIPVVFLGLLILLKTVASVLAFIIILGASIWLAMQATRAHLISNAVKVSDKNFPEIYALLADVKHVLDYHKDVDIYVIDGEGFNAFLAKFFDTKFIVLHAELVEEMIQKQTISQLKWVVARFVGSLKAKHDKLALFRIIIEGVESIKIFNIFILPYERAIQYSGDQIGLAVCGDLSQAMMVFQKQMVGNKLSAKLSAEGILEQKKEMGIMASVARLFSAYPHQIDRFANLLSFAEEKYPKLYHDFMAHNKRSR